MSYDNAVKRTVSEIVRIPSIDRELGCVLMLPSVDMLDFKHLVSRGFITNETCGILVEKDYDKAHKINRYIEDNGFNVIVHRGLLQELRYDRKYGEMFGNFILNNGNEYKTGVGFYCDYADLDTCNVWNSDIYDWIGQHLRPALDATAYDFMLTVAATNRPGYIYPAYGKIRPELRIAYFNKWIRENVYGPITASDCREDILYALHLALGFNPEKNAINSIGYRAQSHNMVVYKASVVNGKVKSRKPFNLPNFSGCYCMPHREVDKLRERMIELCRKPAPEFSSQRQCHPLARP